MSKYLELTKEVFGEKHAEKQVDQIPYVGYSFIEDKVIYSVNPNYLCLEPLEENNQLALSKIGDFSNIKYSFDKKNWNNFPVDSNNPLNFTYITVDKPVYLRGYNLNGILNSDKSQGCVLASSGKYNISGDITTLLNIVGDVKDLTPYGNHGVFYGLFARYEGLLGVDIVDASKLILPATELADSCYNSLFYGCTSLTSAPELPATTLADHCYEYMFRNCISLTTAPVLPATTLADSCYSYMFLHCSLLVTAPELPATTLADSCYSHMFLYCSSLVTAPELPATELVEGCYSSMFEHCTSLVTAPELPATTLAGGCYGYMFGGCKSLNHIKCLATDISATNCTTEWVYNVSSTGTFIKHPDMTDWTTGVNGIPSGWTVEDAVL